MPHVNVEDLLKRKQDVLEARLGLSDAITHPTARGDIKEFNWVQVLDEFLPNRYRVSRGAFIIDSRGRRSSEIDLVIHDNYFHPELFAEATRRLIPAESVYAVFEIKPSLNKPNVEYAIKKAQEVRRLHRTNGPVVHAGGVIQKGTTKEPLWITAGILTSRSAWGDPFGPSLERALGAASKRGRLDVGYAVEHGAFEVAYSGSDFSITSSPAGTGLLFFLTRMFSRVQGSGSVPVIDLTAYHEVTPLSPGGR